MVVGLHQFKAGLTRWALKWKKTTLLNAYCPAETSHNYY